MPKVIVAFLLLAGCCYAQADYTDLSNAFREKMTMSLGEDTATTFNDLSVYVSKQLLKSAVQATVNKAEIQVEAKVENKPFNGIDPFAIKFGKIVKSCPTISCPSCDRDCGRFSFGCKAKEAACEIFERKPCQAAKAIADAGCGLAKSLLDQLEGVEIAKFEFEDVKAGGTISTSPLRLELTDDLSGASVSANNINAKVTVSGRIKPRINTQVAVAQVLTGLTSACLPVQPTVSMPATEVGVTVKRIEIESKFEASREESPDGSALRVSITEMKPELVTNIRPLFVALDRNPHMYATCIAGAVGLNAVRIYDQFFPIQITVDQSFRDLASFKIGQIGPIDIPGLEGKITFTPKAGNLSLGVTEKRVPVF